MPTLRQLSYLIAIADERHFGRAAERVHVAQPTLSLQFAALERKLGARLVERDRNGANLTPFGREIADRARRVLRDVQGIIDLSQSATAGIVGNLKLGVPPTLGPYLLPHIVPGLHKQFPDLKLFVREGTPRRLQDELALGELDLLLTPLPAGNPALFVQVLFVEKLLVVCAPDHPFAKKKTISMDDLEGQKVLTLESGHHLHSQVRDLCKTCGATLLYEYSGTSLDTLRHMVGMGVGISFFPELYVMSEVRREREVKVLKLRGTTLSREIGLAWRKSSSVENTYAEIARIIEEKIHHKIPR